HGQRRRPAGWGSGARSRLVLAAGAGGHRVAAALPRLEAALDGGRVVEALVAQLAGLTGRGRLLGSSAVKEDLPLGIDATLLALEVVARDRAGDGHGETLLVVVVGAEEERLAGGDLG